MVDRGSSLVWRLSAVFCCSCPRKDTINTILIAFSPFRTTQHGLPVSRSPSRRPDSKAGTTPWSSLLPFCPCRREGATRSWRATPTFHPSPRRRRPRLGAHRGLPKASGRRPGGVAINDDASGNLWMIAGLLGACLPGQDSRLLGSARLA